LPGVIANRGRVAHHDKQVADVQRVRGQQITLDAQEVAPARGKVQHRLDAGFSLHQVRHRPRAHAHSCARRIGNVDHVRALLLEHQRAGKHAAHVKALGRAHLDADNKCACRELVG